MHSTHIIESIKGCYTDILAVDTFHGNTAEGGLIDDEGK